MIAAIIQARMSSSRLPGKVLKKVMGKPLLGYLVERLGFCRRLDDIIIATTVNDKDDPIVQFAEESNISFYRGSEEDVLDRFYQTARKFAVEHILHITGDCPLIDPQVCDHVVEVFLSSEVDVVHTGPTYSEGVDSVALSFRALERAWCEATLRSEREHITLYLYNHPDLFKKVTLVNETDDSKYRFTVDEREDFFVVEKALKVLYREGSRPFTVRDVKEFLDANPDIYRLNQNVIRNEGLLKSLRENRGID